MQDRRTTDKFNLSGMKDGTFWINTAMMSIIAYFLMNINADFRILQRAVTSLSIEAAKRDAKMQGVLDVIRRHEVLIDRNSDRIGHD